MKEVVWFDADFNCGRTQEAGRKSPSTGLAGSGYQEKKDMSLESWTRGCEAPVNVGEGCGRGWVMLSLSTAR